LLMCGFWEKKHGSHNPVREKEERGALIVGEEIKKRRRKAIVSRQRGGRPLPVKNEEERKGGNGFEGG